MPTSTADQIREAKAWRIIQKLRNYHHQGRIAKASTQPNSYWMEQWGVSDASVRKFKAFANGYSDEQLEEFCKLRREGGMLPFHWGYVSCFLSVSDAIKRFELQKKAAKKNWTVAEVQTEVRWINGEQKSSLNSRGGRRLKPLIDRPRTLTRLIRDMKGLDRRLQQAIDGWQGLLLKKTGRNQVVGMGAAFAEVAESINRKFTRLKAQLRSDDRLG